MATTEKEIERPDELGSRHRPPYRLDPSKLEELPEKQATLLQQMRKAVPRLAESVEDAVEHQRRRLEEDGRFTEEGIEDRLSEQKEELAAKFLSDRADQDLPGSGLPHQRLVVKRLKKKALQKREEMPLVPEAEPTDARSAVREQALLEKLEAADHTDRYRLAEKMLDTGDPEAVRAVLDPPGGLTPLNEQHMSMLRRRRLDQEYGGDAVQAEAMMQAAEEAESLLDTLEDHMRTVLEAEAAE